MLALYRKLIRLNASSPALRHGAPAEVRVNNPAVYAAIRTTDTEAVLVLANFSATPVRNVGLDARNVPQKHFPSVTDEIVGAQIAAADVDSAGNIRDWQPLQQLSPLSVYVARWR